jgi:hypothetical protein
MIVCFTRRCFLGVFIGRFLGGRVRSGFAIGRCCISFMCLVGRRGSCILCGLGSSILVLLFAGGGTRGGRRLFRRLVIYGLVLSRISSYLMHVFLYRSWNLISINRVHLLQV